MEELNVTKGDVLEIEESQSAKPRPASLYRMGVTQSNVSSGQTKYQMALMIPQQGQSLASIASEKAVTSTTSNAKWDQKNCQQNGGGNSIRTGPERRHGNIHMTDHIPQVLGNGYLAVPNSRGPTKLPAVVLNMNSDPLLSSTSFRGLSCRGRHSQSQGTNNKSQCQIQAAANPGLTDHANYLSTSPDSVQPVQNCCPQLKRPSQQIQKKICPKRAATTRPTSPEAFEENKQIEPKLAVLMNDPEVMKSFSEMNLSDIEEQAKCPLPMLFDMMSSFLPEEMLKELDQCVKQDMIP